MAKKKGEDLAEILQVTEAAGLVHFLMNEYEEGANADGVGSLYALKNPRDFAEVPAQVLSTNDTVRVVWASPGGTLWTGSADGIVATQAKAKWPKYSGPLQYNGVGKTPKWSAIALPPTAADGVAPNITALWGTSDQHVFAGTFTGDIYQGGVDGWKQVFDGAAHDQDSIDAFGGSGPDDVFAVGSGGQILHFDGQAWRALRAPGKPNGAEGWSDVHTLPNGEVLILGAGDQSRLLHGTAANLTEFGRYDLTLIAMAPLGADRLLFATTEGVAELVGHDVQLIQTEYEPITAFAGQGRVFFTEAEQPGPAFVEYDPRQADKPWDRPTF